MKYHTARPFVAGPLYAHCVDTITGRESRISCKRICSIRGMETWGSFFIDTINGAQRFAYARGGSDLITKGRA